jgi:hypothetical protein
MSKLCERKLTLFRSWVEFTLNCGFTQQITFRLIICSFEEGNRTDLVMDSINLDNGKVQNNIKQYVTPSSRSFKLD